jgi:HAD superfamily hydrolase (TIGR01662 family)
VTSHIDVVFLDVGGPLYSDRHYYRGLLSGIREVHPDVDEAEFWAAYDECRADQRGPFTSRLATRFAPEDADRAMELGQARWTYPPDALQSDAREALEGLSGSYRLGVLANQQKWIREAMARDGLDRFIDIWAVSAELGVEKPDPRIFAWALTEAGANPSRCVMVGDRLDNDIAAAKEAGMRAVWLLRGEAPDEPTDEQLSVADAAVRTLSELAGAIEGL